MAIPRLLIKRLGKKIPKKACLDLILISREMHLLIIMRARNWAIAYHDYNFSVYNDTED